MRRLLVLLAFMMTFPASAATYYVRTDGNSGASGLNNTNNASTGAWRIQDINDKTLAAGDVVLIQPGTYTAKDSSSQFGAIMFDSSNSGSSGNPVIIQCDSLVAQACDIDAIEDGNRSPRTYGSSGACTPVADSDCSTSAAPAHATRKMGIFVSGASWITFRRLYVHDAYSTGVWVSNNSDNIIFENGEIAWNGWASAESFRHNGAYANETSDNVTFKNNIIHDNGWTTNPYGHGLYLQADGASVIGNVFYGNQGYGVQVNAGAVASLDTTKIYNNTFGTSPNRGGVVFYNGTFTAAEVKNNIFYNTSYYAVERLDSTFTSAGNLVINSNIDYSMTGRWLCGGSGDSCTYKTETNWNTANPSFTNAGANNYTLQSGSPAINAGLTLSSASPDLLGVTRPSGASYDIGAYEYVAGVFSNTTRFFLGR
jgi:hypothetical protein